MTRQVWRHMAGRHITGRLSGGIPKVHNWAITHMWDLGRFSKSKIKTLLGLTVEHPHFEEVYEFGGRKIIKRVRTMGHDGYDDMIAFIAVKDDGTKDVVGFFARGKPKVYRSKGSPEIVRTHYWKQPDPKTWNFWETWE